MSSLPLCCGLPNEAGLQAQMSGWPPCAVQYQISKQLSARAYDIVGVNRIPHTFGSPEGGLVGRVGRGGRGVARWFLGVGFWGWDEGTQGPMSLEAGKQRQVTGAHVEAGARSFCSMEFQAVFGHSLSD